jgi:hypothetical protein
VHRFQSVKSNKKVGLRPLAWFDTPIHIVARKTASTKG